MPRQFERGGPLHFTATIPGLTLATYRLEAAFQGPHDTPLAATSSGFDGLGVIMDGRIPDDAPLGVYNLTELQAVQTVGGQARHHVDLIPFEIEIVEHIANAPSPQFRATKIE